MMKRWNAAGMIENSAFTVLSLFNLSENVFYESHGMHASTIVTVSSAISCSLQSKFQEAEEEAHTE